MEVQTLRESYEGTKLRGGKPWPGEHKSIMRGLAFQGSTRKGKTTALRRACRVKGLGGARLLGQVTEVWKNPKKKNALTLRIHYQRGIGRRKRSP